MKRLRSQSRASDALVTTPSRGRTPLPSNPPSDRTNSAAAPLPLISLAEELAEYQTAVSEELSALSRVPIGVPAVIQFNVGGEMFDVAITTLQKFPTSLLFRLACAAHSDPPESSPTILRVCGNNSNSSSSPLAPPREERAHGDVPSNTVLRDQRGRIFIDRDPEVFRLLVNLLRGYKVPVPVPSSLVDLFPQLVGDASYYGVSKALSEALPEATLAQFSGPGSAEGGKALRAGTVVGVATPFFSSGLHCVRFLIERCDGVINIGVISEYVNDFSVDFCTMPGCAGYAHTGAIHYSFPCLKLDETQIAYDAECVVGVHLDFEKHYVKWTCNDQVVRILKFTPPKLAVAVALRKLSAVRILDS